jgi:hypothetical protein
MKISVKIDGDIAQQWATAKAAMKAAEKAAIERFTHEAARVKAVCGQKMLSCRIPDGEHFRDVFISEEGISESSVIGGYHAKDNVCQPVEDHWSCYLSAVVEMTLAISQFQPTMEAV